jgi:hypothetical protein
MYSSTILSIRTTLSLILAQMLICLGCNSAWAESATGNTVGRRLFDMGVRSAIVWHPLGMRSPRPPRNINELVNFLSTYERPETIECLQILYVPTPVYKDMNNQVKEIKGAVLGLQVDRVKGGTEYHFYEFDKDVADFFLEALSLNIAKSDK